MRPNLKKARMDKGLTQQAMADKLHISLRAYKYIESGHTVGKVELWDALEDMLGIHQRILRSSEEIVNGNIQNIPDTDKRI